MTNTTDLQNGYMSPVSFAQQRLWFLDQLLPNSPLYNIANTMQIKGPLNIPALKRSFNEIVRRHDSLRTTFIASSGTPKQVIVEEMALPLALIDLTTAHSTLDERWSRARQLALEEAERPFQLTHRPLLRTTLVRIDTQDYLLLLTMHHIISDGWSMSVFMGELSALYTAYSQGQPSPLSELPIQYADFTEWQNEWLQGDAKQKLVDYWKPQLEGLAPLELPMDHPRPTAFSYRGGRERFTLPASLTQSLKVLSQQEGVTLFMTLLAAFQLMLARYAGQEDIAVGSPIANRTRTELEALIGFFANTLVLRTDLSGNPSFRQLLHRVREMLLGAYAHQDLPFEQLVEELQVPRDPSRNPLFQVMFVFQNTPSFTNVTLPDLTLDIQESYIGTAKFDLLLSITEDHGVLDSFFEYSTDLFTSSMIERMIGHYQTLLAGIVAQPEASLADLPLLPAQERQQLLVEWNATTTPFPAERCIHQLIEEQVERTPNTVALLSAGQSLTYRELNAQANQLAQYLRQQGVRIGGRVGLCLERSLSAFVALLGILKAGAAYVPVDPANPSERKAFLLADAAVDVLLTQEQLVPTLPSYQGQVICLDRDWPQIASLSTQNLALPLSARNLFYVMYTSGSTGRPKGVAMSHRALCNLLHWQLETMVEPRAALLLQYASLSFDVSFQEIFPTLSAGGTIVTISEEQRRDPQALLHVISQQQIQKLYLPMVTLQQLADTASLQPVPLPHLREITAAGEQLVMTPQMRAFFQLAPNCTLHNFYGPTETHGTTIYTLSGLPEQWPSLVPIGRPIWNDQNYVLDAAGQPVPIGVAGELYLGGVGLAEGYFGRADLTAEKFVPDPFSGQPGARLYRTGDLARYRADGELEFLGRIDHQVKIRGFRVELEEIEAVLKQHPGVRECVVIVREDVPGDKRLVAYVVAHVQPRPSTSELRALAQEQLQAYMVPAHYVLLEALPLTMNRKVDRRRLPMPDQERAETSAQYVAPRTATEQKLAAIWSEILRVEQIGIHDNFFVLGGHSLLVTQIVSRVRAQFDIDISVRDLFAATTVEQFAAKIDELLLAHLGSTDEHLDEMLALLDSIDDEEAQRLLDRN